MSTGDWDPFEELAKVQKRMNRLFEAALSRTDFDAEGVGSWMPVADVLETEAGFVVRLDLPGLGRDDIGVTVSGDELLVEGQRPMERERDGERFHRIERSYGRFSRRFRLPSNAHADTVRAAYRDGVLEIEVAKNAPGTPSARSVPVLVR